MWVRLAPHFLSAVFLMGCSSSSFAIASPESDAEPTSDDAEVKDTYGSAEVGPEDAVVIDGDHPGPDSTAPVDAAIDAIDAVDAVDAVDAAPEDAGCILAADPADLYVDARVSGESTGTGACPLKTIREALALVAKLPDRIHIIHVAGGTDTAPLIYNETDTLVVRPKTRVVGAGAARVRVTGGGMCAETPGCVFFLQGDTVLEGVSVRGGSRVGLLLAPPAGALATARNVVISETRAGTLAGVFVNGAGSVNLGPAFQAVQNDGPGLYVGNVATLRVVAGGATPNAFNANANGMMVPKGTLNFESGEARDNKAAGLVLGMGGKHAVSKLVARGNVGPGILLETGAGLKLRGSTLVKNRFGVLVNVALSPPEIDLGLTTADPGNNVFGGVTERNTIAGVCLTDATTTTRLAQGNNWSACGPLETPLGGSRCDTVSTYSDVYYVAVGSVRPFDYGACKTGP